MHSSTLITLALIQPLSVAAVFGQCQHLHEGAKLSVLTTIPDVPNLENLAFRSNGDIIVTSSGSAFLHLVTRANNRVRLIANIPDASGLTGIAELEKDVFYVASANFTNPEPIALGTNAVWQVDLRGLDDIDNGTEANFAMISLVTRIPLAGLLNGMTRLSPHDSSHLLLSDSALGRVLSLNVKTKVYETVIDDVLTATRPERLSGVNGIRVYGRYLFYVNQAQRLFAKVPISLSTGHTVGPIKVVVNGTLPFGDDFALSRDGKRAWIALNSQNKIVEVDVLAQTSTVIINSTKLGEGSSVAIASEDPGSCVLYVTGSLAVDTETVGAIFRVSG